MGNSTKEVLMNESSLATVAIDWSNGNLITLKQGETATCNGGLNKGQVYGLFFYNSALNDADTNVTVVGSNGIAPISVKVPGTTAKQGLAAICFVSGDDTNSISVSILQGQPGANIEAFICSVKMPMGSGINNQNLPLDGQPHPFKAFTRYYSVPQSHWYAATITSNINMFMSVLFKENQATVIAVNTTDVQNVISYYGNSQKLVTTQISSTQSIQMTFTGNGSQQVLMNADSVQNANTATVSVQSLQALFVN